MKAMKYRFFPMLGLMALLAAPLAQAQDYDDIYYDASSAPKEVKTVKVNKPAKTVAVYGEIPDRYKVAAQSNYSLERDVDEYNRRGAYDPEYAITLDGDTIFHTDTLYEESFANTRRIERFYNPDIVILSDDDDLVELYYDESPTINLIVGSDYGYASYGWASSYYPWYTGWYEPWYTGWYDPWYSWYSPWHYSWYGPRLWNWNYWGYRPWYSSYWGWNHGWGWHHNWGWSGNYGHHYADWGHRGSGYDRRHMSGTSIGSRAGLATNRNGRSRVGQGTSGGRNGISSRSGNGTVGSRSTGAGTRGGYAGTRGGNMGSRGSGVSTRNSGSVSRPSSYGGSRSSGGYSSGSRSSGGSYSGGSRSGGSYSGGSRSSGGSSGGSYSGGGSRGSSGGGSHGGSSGGGGRRR
jgi:hypothetical protein